MSESLTESSGQLAGRPNKIGFCFLVYDSILWEDCWEAFFKGIEHTRYKIYVHGKTGELKTRLENSTVDRSPLETKWGDISLVKATNRLFLTAFADGCTSAILLSGDMLPLWPFDVINDFCSESRFSVQPPESFLAKWQILMNRREHSKIRSAFRLKSSMRLEKQNMFFCLSKKDADRINTSAIEVYEAINSEIPDEYFWINLLLMAGQKPPRGNFVKHNPDKTKTKAIEITLDEVEIMSARREGFLFIRKVIDFGSIKSKLFLNSVISSSPLLDGPIRQ